MVQVLVTVLLSTTAMAQTSTTSVSPSQSASSSWSGTLGLQVDRAAAERKAVESEASSPLYDVDAESFFTILSVGAKRKLSNDRSFAIIQRIGYSQSINADRQLPAELGYLRLHYQIPLKTAGADGALILRLEPAHTPFLTNDWNALAKFSVIPALSWDLNPRLSVGYSGYFGASLYKGAQRGLDAYQKMVVRDDYRKGYQAALAKASSQSMELDEQAAASAGEASAAESTRAIFSRSAQERNYYVALNSLNVGYKLNEQWSLSQNLGHGYLAREHRNVAYANDVPSFLPNTAGMWVDVGTAAQWSATKALSLELSVAQQHPLLPGSADPVTGKAITWRDGFSPYIAEQTTLSFNAAYTF